MKKRFESQGQPPNQWLTLLNLGWVLAISMATGVIGGMLIDRRFGTAPVFLLLGVFLGFGASGFSFYQTVRRLDGGSPSDAHPKPKIGPPT